MLFRQNIQSTFGALPMLQLSAFLIIREHVLTSSCISGLSMAKSASVPTSVLWVLPDELGVAEGLHRVQVEGV